MSEIFYDIECKSINKLEKAEKYVIENGGILKYKCIIPEAGIYIIRVEIDDVLYEKCKAQKFIHLILPSSKIVGM